MQNFLEFQCFVDDFRIINVYQCFFILNISFDEVDSGLGLEKCFIRYHLYQFFLKTVTNDLNYSVTLVKN